MGIAWLCGGEQGEAVCVCVSAENVCNGLCGQLCVSVWYAGICLCTCWEYGLSLGCWMDLGMYLWQPCLNLSAGLGIPCTLSTLKKSLNTPHTMLYVKRARFT